MPKNTRKLRRRMIRETERFLAVWLEKMASLTKRVIEFRGAARPASRSM